MYEYINTRIIPSYLESDYIGSPVDTGSFSSNQLFIGEVKEIIYPSNKQKSKTGKYNEYIVDVEYRESNGATSIMKFYNCQILDKFGGVSDKFRYTLRPDSTEAVDKAYTKGSKVLLLCVLGDRTRGFIVGGIREDTHTDTQEEGHNLYWEFNGISFSINKDGELSLVFRGKTDIDGEMTGEEEAQPTTIQILKNGNLEVTTKDSNQFLKIDHENKKIDILADKQWNVNINEQWNVVAGKEVDFSFNDTHSMLVEKKWFVDCHDEIEFNASKKIYYKSEGVHIGDAGEEFPMFTTYRKEEKALHNKLKSNIDDLNSKMMQVGSSFVAASVMMKVPVGGAVAASVPIQTAGQAMIEMAAILIQMSMAIASFEAKANTYMSSKNRND
jgi:hypothetical protein